jgi:hypothetical protein
MDNLPEILTCGCLPEFSEVFQEFHGSDECPKTSAPCCNAGPPYCEATCAGETVDHTMYSEEFDKWILDFADPIAQVRIYFDDFGSVTGETILSCNINPSVCASCSINDKLTPLVEYFPNNKAKLKLDIHAENAFWGGPYGVSAYVNFYFELKK